MKYLLVLIFIYILYNVLGTQENFTSGVVSPDILEATKKGTRAKIVFQDSVRNAAIFDKYLAPSITPEHEYMIFYIDEDNYKKTMLKDNTKLEVPSNTTSSETETYFYKSRLELYNYLKKQDSKFDLNKWQKNTMKCYKNKCKIYLNNLNSEKYRLIVLKKEGENISTIRKVIEFSEEKPYKVFNLSENEEENSFELPFEIPIPCNNFSSELDCPDSIAGTILSRCYYDKDLQKCTKTYEEEYLT
jgi:hypothetical protein